jgi:hypothetical protein
MAARAAKVSACVGGGFAAKRTGALTKMENRKTRFARRGAGLRQPVLAPASRIKKNKSKFFSLGLGPPLEKAWSTGRTPPNLKTKTHLKLTRHLYNFFRNFGIG